eukprot:6668629-Lingulodinium_polyedra.AAC.1
METHNLGLHGRNANTFHWVKQPPQKRTQHCNRMAETSLPPTALPSDNLYRHARNTKPSRRRTCLLYTSPSPRDA